jgi:transposase
MKEITVIGIDLAKHIFQICGTNKAGRAILSRRVSREQLLHTLAKFDPCLVGMEACGGAHHWAREIAKLGHEVRLISPQYVKPYVKTNKNDYADAEAIAEAVTRPGMRFVAVKTVEQQAMQSLHRVREQMIKQRVACINTIHALVAEYGIVLPKQRLKFRQRVASLMEPGESRLPGKALAMLKLLTENIAGLDDKISQCDERVEALAKESEVCKRLQTIPGVGPLAATALAAAVPNAAVFKNGRELSAWLGLVPRQHSSGGKSTLLGISKRGDKYLRKLLVHGARSVITHAEGKTDRLSRWAWSKRLTRGNNRAIVALANKNARIVWALLKKGEEYRTFA